jgi:hypothetical protein
LAAPVLAGAVAFHFVLLLPKATQMSKKYNFIRMVLITGTLLLAITAQAQTGKDSLMKVVTKDVCDELSKKDFTGKSMDDMQMEMGMAFMPVMMRHQEALEKQFGGSIMNKETIEKVAQEIGMRLMVDCPDFFKMMSGSGMMQAEGPKISTSLNESIKGTLVKVVPGEMTHLLVRDAKGKTVKIWWMDYFDGSDEMADNPQRMANKKATITYTEKEVYSAALKQYVKIKVATGIKFP